MSPILIWLFDVTLPDRGADRYPAAEPVPPGPRYIKGLVDERRNGVQTPLEISFHNLDFSTAVEAKVRTRIQGLEKLFGRITSCHVHIEAPHQRRGNRFEVRIETRIPGAELAVSNDPGNSKAHDDIYVALRDAFNAMGRQLKRWKRRMRGEGKHCPETARP